MMKRAADEFLSAVKELARVPSSYPWAGLAIRGRCFPALRSRMAKPTHG